MHAALCLIVDAEEQERAEKEKTLQEEQQRLKLQKEHMIAVMKMEKAVKESGITGMSCSINDFNLKRIACAIIGQGLGTYTRNWDSAEWDSFVVGLTLDSKKKLLSSLLGSGKSGGQEMARLIRGDDVFAESFSKHYRVRV